MRGEHRRQDRAQRERDIRGGQHHHEIRRPHQDVVQRAAGVSRDAAERRANEQRAQRCRRRETERHASAEYETAEHVAAEAVGAEPEQRRARFVGRDDEMSAGEPHERDAPRSVLFIPLFELIHEPPRMDEGCMPRAVVVLHVRPRRRRVQEPREARIGGVRRDDRRRGGCQRGERDDDQARPPAIHAHEAPRGRARDRTGVFRRR